MWSPRSERAAGAAHSLRRRLLLLLVAAAALATSLQAANAYRTAIRQADALFDSQLQALARSLEAGVPVPGMAMEPGLSVQIWGPGGVLLFELGPARLPGPAVIGFSEATVQGVRYRVYSVAASGRAVQVAQDLDRRSRRARELAVDAAVPVAALGMLLMLAVWFVIERSLAPIERLRRQVAARKADVMTPLPTDGLPGEVRPLVGELNQLLARMGEAVQAQQRFVADAAHELRSPLTALRLQVQSLRRDLAGPEREAAIGRMEEGVGRAVALVNQLLVLAREEGTGSVPVTQVLLEDVCRDATSDVLPAAQARRIDLGLHAPGAGPVVVRGDPESLRTLVRNLLDNSVKYTPEGGRVDILLALEEAPDQAPVLAVEDSGPGIAAADQDRAFERFHRGHTPDVSGSGLGLAIVAAVARRHAAEVRLGRSERLGGLRVEVRFPPA